MLQIKNLIIFNIFVLEKLNVTCIVSSWYNFGHIQTSECGQSYVNDSCCRKLLCKKKRKERKCYDAAEEAFCQSEKQLTWKIRLQSFMQIHDVNHIKCQLCCLIHDASHVWKLSLGVDHELNYLRLQWWILT